MSTLLSYYKILNVDARASADQLKQAYRMLALKFHPDTNNGDANAAAMFLLVKNAYEALSDPERRTEIDSFVRTSRAVKSTVSVTGPSRPSPEPKANTWENDLNYIMWDLDDLVGASDFPSAFTHPVLDFLTYLDKWVLVPAGFTSSPARDAREGARDPRSYIDYFVNRNTRMKCEFHSLQDYFFNVKHRVMGFQSWTDPGLIAEIKGARLRQRLDSIREELLYHLMRSQRIGFYYLYEFERVRNGSMRFVDLFVHDPGE